MASAKVFKTRFPSDLYGSWRAQTGLVLALREGPQIPPERLLQLVWFHQRLLREELKSTEGEAIKVLHPGFWNHESGPDFRNALLKFGDNPPQIGDVEVDLQTSNWHGHGHDRNAAFQQVLLHVVWEGERKTSMPTLALKNYLDSSLHELALWLGTDTAQDFPAMLRGKCADAVQSLPMEQVQTVLREASLVRLQSKAAQFQARARQAGWEQSLWEGLFRALGYKHNIWPMHRLAEMRELLIRAGEKQSGPLEAQARLFGIGGLLPDELPRPQSGAGQYIRGLWDIWWREREDYRETMFPRTLWRFHGVRPSNHPQRRLALASHWIAQRNLPEKLELWCAQSIKSSNLVASLSSAFQVPEDPFWSWHWSLNSKRLGKPQPLVGPSRITDLAINVVIPWLWIRAAEGSNIALQREMETRYLSWPSAEDNSVLRLARHRVLGGTNLKAMPGASAQQGLLQIVRDFCQQTNPICENCRFPQLLRSV